jgi:tripartite-type tricarboxylate transporter receptor subunit TctC
VPEFAAGRLHLIAYPPAGAEPHVRSGLLKALMIAGARRSPRYPDIPASVEVGLPTFDSTAWHAILAPAGTPQAIVLKLQQTFKTAIGSPELHKYMATIDVEMVGSTPSELAKFLRLENDKWSAVIKAAGIKLE